MALRILLADDHAIVRQGLKALLESDEFAVVGEAENGHEAVRLARELRPDVAVLDIVMPILNGLEAAREIRRASPGTKTILLTQLNADYYVLEGLKAGIRGYVLKTKAAADLIQAIHDVSRGLIYLSPDLSRTVVDAYLAKSDLPSDPLTPRERQVLQLIAEGRATKEIAALLGISVKTAESHRTSLMEKLDIHEIAGLVRYAIKRGLIQP